MVRSLLGVELKFFRRVGGILIRTSGLRRKRVRSNSLLVSYLHSYKHEYFSTQAGLVHSLDNGLLRWYEVHS